MEKLINYNGCTRQGTLIKSVDFDLDFQIPDAWIDWYLNHEERKNIHLTIPELLKIKNAEGEWDKEYATILNKLFPFENCIAHLGEEGWGTKGISYADLQFRVYVIPNSMENVMQSANSIGIMAIKELTGLQLNPTVRLINQWHQICFKYARNYQDYGANAMVDLRIRKFEDNTVVFAFMHTDHKDLNPNIDRILHSVNLKSN